MQICRREKYESTSCDENQTLTPMLVPTGEREMFCPKKEIDARDDQTWWENRPGEPNF